MLAELYNRIYHPEIWAINQLHSESSFEKTANKSNRVNDKGISTGISKITAFLYICSFFFSKKN